MQLKTINRHGFQFNFGINYSQLFAGFLYTLQYSSSLFLLIELIDYIPIVTWLLIIIFQSLLTLIVIILWFITTRMDTTDQIIYMQELQQTNSNLNLQNYCKICNAYVQNKTKHCRKCNRQINKFLTYFQRCTADFDHHCIWLNNCIGSKNYRSFFAMITTIEIQLISQALLCIQCIIEDLYMGYVLISIQLLLLIPISILFWISTYEYVISQRNQLITHHFKTNPIIDKPIQTQTQTLQKNLVPEKLGIKYKINTNLQSPKVPLDLDQDEAEMEDEDSMHAKNPLPTVKRSGPLNTQQVIELNTNRNNYGQIQLKSPNSTKNFGDIKSICLENAAVKSLNEESIIQLDSNSPNQSVYKQK